MKSFCLPMFRLMVAICALVLAGCGGRSDLDEAFRSPDAGKGGKGGAAGSVGMGGSGGFAGTVGPGGFAGMGGSRIPFCGDGICDPGEPGFCFVDCPNGDKCGDGICGRTETYL